MTVDAPLYMSLIRLLILDIRGALTLEPGYMRWRPTGWYGRRAPRGAGFEIPLTELGSMEVVAHRLTRSDLIFRDLGGNEIKADGNRRVIRLRVKPGEAHEVFHEWNFVPTPDERPNRLSWRPTRGPT
jgi:hypothetical protein